ncbi:zinc-binding alcohol dehydrogenase family protein [Enterococcus massiliensis]|uniref:zinc-binding alcohol dehydrogenase family protein n=1 Tax=Enterococcus massiliensis TaxID=1640685 RepID=UPI00069D2FAF|nr:zinc-binding alcohol dehydrogenase family protein [Enterococcus massiliensis]
MKNTVFCSKTNKDGDFSATILSDTQEVKELAAHDLLVEIGAVAVNPIDLKRQQLIPENQTEVLGYDAVGKVVAMGSKVSTDFLGKRVYYMGTTKREGSYQKYQLVDEELVALAPTTFSDGEAAALPLTSLTAWELLFEKFQLIPEENTNSGKKILLINAGGGVGSIAGQLAKWCGLEVYGTASPKHFSWLEINGVDHCLDYHQDLASQLPAQLKFDFIACFYDSSEYLPQLAALIQPFGRIGSIVNTAESLDLNPLKNLSVSFDWVYVFTKTDFSQGTSQGIILKKIADLVENGKLTSTMRKEFTDGITQKNLAEAFSLVQKGHPGKVVLSGGIIA